MDDKPRDIELLEELVAWARFANRQALITLLDQVLRDDQHLIAFELTDGRRQQEVAEATGLAQPTISGLWQRWRRLGIAQDRGGRVFHLARPTDLGMERAAKMVARHSSSKARRVEQATMQTLPDPALDAE